MRPDAESQTAVPSPLSRRPWAVWLALGLIVLLGLGLRFGYGTQKRGYHVDESFSYLLSANRLQDYQALWEPLRPGAQATEILGRELIAMRRLEPAQHGRYGDLVAATAADVHPPLYYLLLHEAMALGRGLDDKWIGLGLNCLIYGLEAWLLFLLGRRLWPQHEGLALLAVLIWSLSLGAISISLMARMYELLTLWSLLALWSGFGLLLAPRRRELIWLAAACLGGILSHYFFLLLLAPLSALLAWELRRRPAWLAGLFAATALPLGLAALLFPAGLGHLFGSYRAQQMQDLARDSFGGRLAEVMGNLHEYGGKILSYCLPLSSLVLLLALGCGLGWLLWRRQALSGAWTGLQTRILLLLLIYTGIACALTPYVNIRYLAPALPLLAICLVALAASPPGARWRSASLGLLLGSLALASWQGKPDMLFSNFPPPIQPDRPLYVNVPTASTCLRLPYLVQPTQVLRFVPLRGRTRPEPQAAWPDRDFYALIHNKAPRPDFGARHQLRESLTLGYITLLEF